MMKERIRKTHSLKLSPRLQTMVDQLIAPYEIWDLCCDHGLVGQLAYSMGCFHKITFVDQVPHIMNWLEQDFLSRFSLKKKPAKVRFLTADATEVTYPTAGANLVMGGVGAFVINRILERIPLGPRLRLILAPNKNPQLVKDKALSLGFVLTKEILVLEEHRERWILVFDSPSVH
jgi:tRNA (adenine22-N1)-methyltransferase